MNHQRMPVAIGGLMGPMMLWMLHGSLTGDGLRGTAFVIFVGAHLALLALVLAAALFAARLSPRLRERLARMHRPSLTHVTTMLASAVVAAGGVHLFIHGVG